MRIRHLAGLVTATSLLLSSARAADTWTGPPVLVTHGEATVTAVPDRAILTLGTEARANDPKAAQAQDAKSMAAVQQSLAQAGIPEAAIRTVNYDLQLEYDFSNGKQTPRGYVARHTIEVRIDDVRQTGDVIAKTVASGAAAVNGVRFDLKDRAQAERDALKKAVEAARTRADAAAAGAGMSVAGVIHLQDDGAVSTPPPMYARAMRVAADAAAPETPVSAGELEIRASVTLTVGLR